MPDNERQPFSEQEQTMLTMPMLLPSDQIDRLSRVRRRAIEAESWALADADDLVDHLHGTAVAHFRARFSVHVGELSHRLREHLTTRDSDVLPESGHHAETILFLVALGCCEALSDIDAFRSCTEGQLIGVGIGHEEVQTTNVGSSPLDDTHNVENFGRPHRLTTYQIIRTQFAASISHWGGPEVLPYAKLLLASGRQVPARYAAHGLFCADLSRVAVWGVHELVRLDSGATGKNRRG